MSDEAVDTGKMGKI